MQRSLSMTMPVLILLLIQPLLPIALTPAVAEGRSALDPSMSRADLDLLSQIGVQPVFDAEHGWSAPEDGMVAWLAYRDAGLLPLADWSDNNVDGWLLLQHEYPLPTEWLGQLESAGIQCYSFLPPSAFHCRLNGHSIAELEELEVMAMMRLDATDKLRDSVAPLLLGLEQRAFATKDLITVNIVLAGEQWPDLPVKEGAMIILHSHNGRFATATANSLGISLLADDEAIEWIEPRPLFQLYNDVSRYWIGVDRVTEQSNITSYNSNYNALDGSGIIVTIADTGLDNGVNNSNMHPDFQDHIRGILSMPIPSSTAFWSDNSNWDDGASDTQSGHGTHVAGSVLGDGSDSGGEITGVAPEAHLLFQATEQYVNFKPNAGVADGYGLWGLPDDIRDLFDMAAENGSLVHTNSWGSDVDGEYTTTSMQADDAARTYANMSILFAAGNDGQDGNSDGEIDLDSIGAPATGKNVLTIGASENDRELVCNAAGSCFTFSWSNYPSNPIKSDKASDDPEGMAAFSSRGPTDDNRVKPDFSAPGTLILSTKSSVQSGSGWLGYNDSYFYNSGTSMATPLSAGAVALLIEHLKENVGHEDPSSALVKAIMAAGADDMAGQYGSSTNGAGEAAPNNHEGWGRLNLGRSANVSFVDGESLSTAEQLGFRFNVTTGTPDITVMLAWTDPASTTSASVNLVNDLDLSVKDPSGIWTNLSNDRDNLRGLKFTNPSAGDWEVVVKGTSVPIGPQNFALVLSRNFTLINGSTDDDMDGVENDIDDCLNTAGSSSIDRSGCPDSDGDGYSDPDGTWTVADGADEFVDDASQWADSDGDGYGDNVGGNQPDSCTLVAGWSNEDRYGCPDSDGDGWSNPDALWTISQGADSCGLASGTSNQDRNGCEDSDGDGYSDPEDSWNLSEGADAFVNDSSQWVDVDGDGYGDNASGIDADDCPGIAGNSTIDLLGCLDSDGDGISDNGDDFPNDASRNSDLDSDGYDDLEDDCPTTAGNSSNDSIGCVDSDGDGWSDSGDALPNEPSQWLDGDGDGYGDDMNGSTPDACPSQVGTSNQNATYGCPDSDGDGWSDSEDAFSNEASQWSDADGDGYGDEADGINPDACPQEGGNSTEESVLGCSDGDGDGWADIIDDLPDEKTQQSDMDADGFGDDPLGYQPDACLNVVGNSTNDRFGCPDRDGDGMSDDNDDFPDDPLRAGDADADGLDDAIEDDCSNQFGTSSEDRLGCPDSDGDGWSDPDQSWSIGMGADAFELEPSQWLDADGDGYGDNASGTKPDSCPLVQGISSEDRYGCPDSDGDGRSNADQNWSIAQGADAFPGEFSQWSDSDGDGYGDNPLGVSADACADDAGTSSGDRLGCIDSDGDGYSDPDSTWTIADGADVWPDDVSQFADSDGDGYGDDSGGVISDDCPTIAGSSYMSLQGCIDSDFDGWADQEDAFPNTNSQWLDSDGDGWGDNQSVGASRVDHFPDDPDNWSVTATLTCQQSNEQLDLFTMQEIVVTCTISNDADASLLVILIWDVPIGINTGDNRQAIQLTPIGSANAVRQIILRGSGSVIGEYTTVIKVEEPGSDQAMDSVTIDILVIDTSPDAEGGEEEKDESSGDFMMAGIPLDAENLRILIAGAVLLVVVLGIVLRVARPKKAKRKKQKFTGGGLFNEHLPPPPQPPQWQQQSSWKY